MQFRARRIAYFHVDTTYRWGTATGCIDLFAKRERGLVNGLGKVQSIRGWDGRTSVHYFDGVPTGDLRWSRPGPSLFLIGLLTLDINRQRTQTLSLQADPGNQADPRTMVASSPGAESPSRTGKLQLPRKAPSQDKDTLALPAFDRALKKVLCLSSLDRYYAVLAWIGAFPAPTKRIMPRTGAFAAGKAADDEDSSELLESDTPHRALLRSAFSANAVLTMYAFSFALVDPIVIPNLCVALQPDKTKSRDAALTYGKIQALFSMVQVVSSLYLGSVVDKFSERFALLLTLVLGSGASYLMIALSNDMTWLYLSRLPGVLMGTGLVVQTAIAGYHAAMGSLNLCSASSKGGKESSTSSSAASLGRSSLLYRLAHLCGVTVSGYGIVVAGNHAVAGLAVVVCLLASLYAWLWVSSVAEIQERFGLVNGSGDGSQPELANNDGQPGSGTGEGSPLLRSESAATLGLTTERPVSGSTGKDSSEAENAVLYAPLRSFAIVRKRALLRATLLCSFGLEFGLGVYNVSAVYAAKSQFGLSDTETGYLLGWATAAQIIANGFLIEPATAMAGGRRRRAVGISNLCGCVCLVIYGMLDKLPQQDAFDRLLGLGCLTVLVNAFYSLSQTILFSLAADSGAEGWARRGRSSAGPSSGSDASAMDGLERPGARPESFLGVSSSSVPGDDEEISDRDDPESDGPLRTPNAAVAVIKNAGRRRSDALANSDTGTTAPRTLDAAKTDRGLAISTLHSTMALVGVVAPLVGTRVYEYHFAALGWTAGGLVAVGALPMLGLGFCAPTASKK